MNRITQEQILKLIEVGIQAPSADNGQPWKFKLLDDGFELLLDKNNMGLFFDVEQVATLMSCGAVMENVSILAAALGFTTNVSYFNGSANTQEGPSGFARITFVPDGKQQDVEAVSHMLFNRHSDRNLFQFNKAIPDSLMNELVSTVQSYEHYHLHIYQTPQDKNAIIRTITSTDTIRFIHERIHNDFYQVLRFGDTAQKTRDGLAAATLGIESFMIPILEILKPWKLAKLLNYIGLHHVMAFRGTWLPMKSSSQIVSIVRHGGGDYVESGRVMQRFWLEANKKGLSVQALGALPLFLARLHLLQGEGFTSDQLKTLMSLEESFAAITPGFSKDSDQLVMLFRLGYTKQPAEKPYRRTMESFLL